MARVKTYKYLIHKAIHQPISEEASPEAIAARSDVGIFGEYISGFSPAFHHREWLNAIATENNSTCLNRVAGSFLRIASPRGAAKTTWIGLCLAWIIGHNPSIRIILISYSEDISLAISVTIKQYIESDKYKEVFPHIQKSKRWSDSKWFIERERIIKDPTVLAVGAGGGIASRRSDLIVIDDPIKSSEAIANPKVREAMNKWWSEVVRPTLVPGGRAIVLCTRFRVDDIHATTFNEENNWQVITQKAITESGASYWSEYITIQELETIRAENPIAFASQYQNDPLMEENLIIKPEWIRRTNLLERYKEIAIGIDLAASKKESADYTAIVAVGRNGNDYTILDCERGRWSINETIEKIISMHSLWESRSDRITVIIESVAYQAAFLGEFKRIVVERGLAIAASDVRPKGDKEQRLRGISGIFETEKAFFSENTSFTVLIEELLHFGVSAHDDCVDAMVHAFNKLMKSRKALSGGSYN